jgi:hypothetical protein
MKLCKSRKICRIGAVIAGKQHVVETRPKHTPTQNSPQTGRPRFGKSPSLSRESESTTISLIERPECRKERENLNYLLSSPHKNVASPSLMCATRYERWPEIRIDACRFCCVWDLNPGIISCTGIVANHHWSRIERSTLEILSPIFRNLIVTDYLTVRILLAFFRRAIKRETKENMCPTNYPFLPFVSSTMLVRKTRCSMTHL